MLLIIVKTTAFLLPPSICAPHLNPLRAIVMVWALPWAYNFNCAPHSSQHLIIMTLCYLTQHITQEKTQTKTLYIREEKVITVLLW